MHVSTYQNVWGYCGDFTQLVRNLEAQGKIEIGCIQRSRETILYILIRIRYESTYFASLDPTRSSTASCDRRLLQED